MAKKSPIVAVTLHPLDGEFAAHFYRRRRPLKTIMTTFNYANILSRIVNDLQMMTFANVSVGPFGWTASIEDRTVYPPPKSHERREVDCVECDGTGFCWYCYGDIDNHLGPPPDCHVCDGLGLCPFCEGKGSYV